MVFADRADAGRQMAGKLAGVCKKKGIILAIPRGGVVVGAEISRQLDLPLDLVIPRKIGAPHNPEVAIGALTQDGTTVFNRQLLAVLGLNEKDVAGLVEEQRKEIERRLLLYRGDKEYPDYSGRCIIVVDDGIATGYTVIAALRWIWQKFRPEKLILAVPVAPADILDRLEKEVDQLVVLMAPEDFYAVGQFYQDFRQVTDREVIQLLNERRAVS